MKKKDFGWCFIGSGGITRRVLADVLEYADGSYPASVYSKTQANAQKFGEAYGAAVYQTAEEALSDPNVRAAYICTTHPSHKEYTIMALNKNIPVLCEKPAAMNAAEAREMVSAAKNSNTYFMEAMWTRHNPVIKQVVEWVRQCRIGKAHALSASFSFSHPFNANSRLYDPKNGGGALLDVGVYVIAFARSIFPEMPVSIQAAADFAPTGVDCLNAMIFKYSGGSIARLYSGISADEPNDAYIAGENGHIYVPHFWAPKKAVLRMKNGQEETFNGNFNGEGFQFEFDAVKSDILAGKKENTLVTHEFTLDVMGLVDKVGSAFRK